MPSPPSSSGAGAVGASQPPRAVPSEEAIKPEIYEQGSNIGPVIEDALECEHLDADLYRSAKVSSSSSSSSSRSREPHCRGKAHRVDHDTPSHVPLLSFSIFLHFKATLAAL